MLVQGMNNYLCPTTKKERYWSNQPIIVQNSVLKASLIIMVLSACVRFVYMLYLKYHVQCVR